jgi:hypothetical protein
MPLMGQKYVERFYITTKSSYYIDILIEKGNILMAVTQAVSRWASHRGDHG